MADFRTGRWWGTTDTSNHRRVLVFPGVHYDIGQPGLMLPARALAERGWTVWSVDWRLDDDKDRERRLATILAAADELDAISRGARTTLVLAKSIGSFTAPWAARNAWPGIWVTPLVRFDEVRDALANNPAPQLLVDGSTDTTWDEARARATGKQVEVVGPVDHALMPVRGWKQHLAALDRLTQASVDFSERL